LTRHFTGLFLIVTGCLMLIHSSVLTEAAVTFTRHMPHPHTTYTIQVDGKQPLRGFCEPRVSTYSAFRPDRV
jgi:hypothetical protein